MTVPAGYHATRLPVDARRDVVWGALWRYHFAAQIGAGDCVLDLGAGYGSFINAVAARRRIAVDAWPGFVMHLAPGVEGVVTSVTALDELDDGSVDFVMASNLFEHLTQADLALTLDGLAPKMSGRGTMTIIQPNYRYAYREYFDDFDHKTAWSHISLPDFLTAQGWVVDEVRPRFMPLTVKSRLPVSASLVRLWLASPWKPGGAQMLIRAVPPR